MPLRNSTAGEMACLEARQRLVGLRATHHFPDVEMTSVAPLSGARTGWKGSEIDYREHGLHVFSEAELAEIERALRHLLALPRRDFTDVTPESFPLERLGEYMRELCDTLRNGPGFALLRGIPRERYSADEMAWIYVGLGSYLGRPTSLFRGFFAGLADYARRVHCSAVNRQPRLTPSNLSRRRP